MDAACAYEAPRTLATVACADLRDRFFVSTEAFRVAEMLGFPRKASLEIAMCASELASNAVRHGGGGSMDLIALPQPNAGLELACSDEGPGFADFDAALQDGYSKGRLLGPDDRRLEGLGVGLGAVRRMMHELLIDPRPGKGSTVRARRYLSVGSATRARR